MLAIALLLGSTIAPADGAGPRLSAVPGQPIELPPPSQDADRDTYADAVDRVEGDAHVRISVEEVDAGGILPYLVVGTQDDHWRFGKDRELEWRHVVDPDPLGHRVGSKGWVDHAIRTGAWWTSTPMDGASKIMAPSGRIDAEALERPGWSGVDWPQTFHVNVRDDADNVTVELELVDADPDPDRVVGRWDIVVDVVRGTWRHGDGSTELGNVSTLTDGSTRIDVRLGLHGGIPPEDKQIIAKRWAPEIRFDSEERFFPTSGQALETFHGFSRNAPADADLRTWTMNFNNGRDGYILLLADFTGDRRVDHRDVEVMTDILRAGQVAPDTVSAQVAHTTGDRVVVQYWFIYMYNFVEDEGGDGVPALAHKGDREFIQLVFPDLDAAMAGEPESIAYSQHYRGVSIEDPDLDGDLFNGTHPLVFPARGSHASYPAPGDDRRFRSALAGYGDKFDGRGETWDAGSYTLEVLDRQSWAFGHLWGPPTRHSRDLGTATRPLLQYGFDYPYIDPLLWQHDLRVLPQDELDDLYGGDR